MVSQYSYLIILLALVSPYTMAVSSEELKAPSFVGIAYQKDNGKVLYSEEHYKNGQVHEVKYREPDGHIFAEKNIQYVGNHTAPTFIQINHRNGELIDIKNDGKNVSIHYKEAKDEQPEVESISYSPKTVIDAGFDHYIVENWASLLEGETHTIEYLLPSHQRTIELKIEKNSCAENDDKTCFLIAANSWVFRMLSQPLNLTYDTQLKRLLVFEGRSNICNEQGSYQDVQIRYSF